jgi:hypothetical protein
MGDSFYHIFTTPYLFLLTLFFGGRGDIKKIITSDITLIPRIDCTSRSRIFHLHGGVTITGEGLQNLGLCWALRAFEQGGIFIVPHML